MLLQWNIDFSTVALRLQQSSLSFRRSQSELENPLCREEIVFARAGASRQTIVSESAFEYPIDLDGGLEGKLELELDLKTLEALGSLDSDGTGTSRVVDHSEAASEDALVLEVLVVFVDAVDFRLGVSGGKTEYLDSVEQLRPRVLEIPRGGEDTFIKFPDDTAETSDTFEIAEFDLVLGSLSISKVD
ncbi:hypothetical protein EYC84_002008 [Monilinia fructicola]|uniref:Uncharacterized protein n=1 Tax=Monilinia fructicola TaxID=38448 RepID=A0A5M9JUF3_MONFR|nr:hypothetical protein EYC84_002008 [Monilinia fructicola]